MVDADRFLGVDHGASRSAADVAGPSRSASTFAIPDTFTDEEAVACRCGFNAGLDQAVIILERAKSAYSQNGSIPAVETLDGLISELHRRQIDVLQPGLKL